MSEPPEILKCPITHELFEDPVIAGDGFTYERSAILAAWKKHGMISPLTRQPMGSTLIENKATKSAVQEWREKRSRVVACEQNQCGGEAQNFCATHRMLVCNRCCIPVGAPHKNCTAWLQEDLGDKIATSLGPVVKRIKGRSESLQSTADALDQLERRLDDDAEKAVESIKERRNRVRSAKS
mmetsp:Transcript_38099/g.74842  ORF Transcript_38099/g.74842 Transcript_38099/m.74842 type:complete len:182 (+) Transcript_38099:119-664(+)